MTVITPLGVVNLSLIFILLCLFIFRKVPCRKCWPRRELPRERTFQVPSLDRPPVRVEIVPIEDEPVS